MLTEWREHRAVVDIGEHTDLKLCGGGGGRGLVCPDNWRTLAECSLLM